MVAHRDDILEKKFTEAFNLLELGPESSDRKNAIDTLNELQNTYYELLDYYSQASWKDRVENIQGQATYIASIAVFLGAVQIAFIAYTATIFPTSKANSTVQEITNIFSFCALLFDVLGALFALITSGTLLSRASEAKKFNKTKEEFFSDIVNALKAFTDSQEAQSIFCPLRESGQSYHMQAQRLAHLIDDHSQSYFDVLLIIIAGVACFFASFFLFLVSTQPFRVWLSTVVVTGITTVMLLFMQTHRYPGALKEALETTKRVFAALGSNSFTS